jgi:hypothetical protein
MRQPTIHQMREKKKIIEEKSRKSKGYSMYVLLRAKKVGHQISVSFEKFDVVQALLSFF